MSRTLDAPQSQGAAPSLRFVFEQRAWFDVLARAAPRILIVQRDNIGDLVLSTPFIRALRACLKDATLDILVNSYNAPVLAGNPDLSHQFEYTKAKHRAENDPLIAVYWRTWRLWRQLRANRYDLAVLLAGRFSESSLRPALAARVPQIAGLVDGSPPTQRIALGVNPQGLRERHIVARTGLLLDAIVPPTLRAQFWPGPLGACRVYPDERASAAVKAQLAAHFGGDDAPLVGVHISARKVDQRWPAQHFVEFMRAFHARARCRFMLFWSPGTGETAMHPGDDAKAEEIRVLTEGLPVFMHPTRTLSELIAGLSLPEIMLCSDGGAMHLAAAQSKPIIALFGNSDPRVWHPWGSPFEVLAAPSHKVADIPVERVTNAMLRLLDYARKGRSAGRSSRPA